MQFEEKTIERKEIYQGPIFQVVTDQVELPDGKGQAQRDLIFHNGAVAVLPITDEGKTMRRCRTLAGLDDSDEK